jgi:hypothetical protein
MKITGRRTLRIFMRYNIISTGQLHGYGQGHVEEEGGKVTRNNANSPQSWDATSLNLSYLLSYQ